MTDVPPLLTKRCCDCKEWRAIEDFYRDRSQKDGFNRRCKKCSSDRFRAKWQNDPEWRERQKKRLADYARSPAGRANKRKYDNSAERIVAVRIRHRRYREDPKFKEQKRKSHRIQTLRLAIAVETCKRLGIDLTKLAKEQYDAEQREKHARTENLQQGERASARDPEAANGRPGDQAGRRRARSAVVVPATGE